MMGVGEMHLCLSDVCIELSISGPRVDGDGTREGGRAMLLNLLEVATARRPHKQPKLRRISHNLIHHHQQPTLTTPSLPFPLNPRSPSIPENNQPHQTKPTKPHRQRFPRPQSTRDTAPGQNHTGQQRALDAVGLPVCDAVAADGVQEADADACSHGRDRAGARVAGYSAAGGEGGEEVGYGSVGRREGG